MRMTDPKTELYRYTSFERFMQLLFAKEITLIPPSKWQDKYELYWLEYYDTEDGKSKLEEFVSRGKGQPEKYISDIKSLAKFTYSFSYCLCFSEVKDAEVFWNARSYNNKGIMYATTAGKISNLLPESTIKEVAYDLENIKTEDHLHSYDPNPSGTVLNDPDQLLLHKRKCFEYEQEVRVIVTNGKTESGVLKRPIPELESFIDGVMVHPCANMDYVQLVELICHHFNIPFWGKSKVYDFAPII